SSLTRGRPRVRLLLAASRPHHPPVCEIEQSKSKSQMMAAAVTPDPWAQGETVFTKPSM
ncbi:unnamed protein product, partial [Ectocarpus sp. 12 AP-2014]